MPNKILIVDEDDEIRKITGIYLKNEGYEVLKAESGEQALKVIDKNEIDLVLIDIMMFGMMNWIEAFMKIRKNNIMPIVFLDTKSGDFDEIQRFTSEADDYIRNPFNAEELIAIVKLQLKRYKMNSNYQKLAENKNKNKNKIEIEIGNLTINCDTRQTFIGNNEIRLTPKEFDILELLARNKGIVFSIEKIYEMVWGKVFYKSDSTVMVHITKIREKIEEEPKKPIYIKTIWGVGYKV